MISLAGLFLTGIDVFSGMAVGAIGVVGIAVLGSVTVLPALLAWLGRRVDRGRLPLIGRRRTAARRSRLWDALVRRVVRRPALLGGAATIALLALAAPALGMRTGDPGLDDLPASTPVIQSLRHIEQAFPGGPDPAKVVVTGDRLDRPEVRQAVGALRAYAAGSGGAYMSRSPRWRPRPAASWSSPCPWPAAAPTTPPPRRCRPSASAPSPRPSARSTGSLMRSPGEPPTTTTSPRPCTRGRPSSSGSCSRWRSCCWWWRSGR